MDFVVRSLAVTAHTGIGHVTANTTSVKFGNSTQATPTPTSFNLGTATPHFGNATQIVAGFNSSAILNITRTPDLNNATECLMQYWAESHSQTSWFDAHHTTYTITTTYQRVERTGIPLEPLGNISYTRLCDGLPRFADEADEAKVVVTLPTPITKSYVRTQLAIDSIGTEDNPYTNFPQCSISPGEECSNLWKMFASSLSSTLSDWSSTNVLTISVAPTPTVITVNGEATPLTAAPGQLPALPIHNNIYTAGADNIWSIDDAYNFVGETFITPGQQVTFTWNYGDKPKPNGPSNRNCTRPVGTIVQSACSTTAACTITAKSVDLIFFPPPSKTRDVCANTSPGFNKYTQSIYSHPHKSVVINSTTFWMDKAYVRYNTVSAYKRCEADNGLQIMSTGVGGTYTNTVVQVESSDLSTICGWQLNPTRPYGIVIAATPVPMNFDDFNGPAPESAYQCIQRCGMRGGCSSIVQSLFNPHLAVPPQVRALDPEWASCVPYFEGTHDPPIALSSVSDFFSTAVPGHSPTPSLSPTPGLSPSASLPIQTGGPDGSSDSDPPNPPNPPNPGNSPQPPPNNGNPSNTERPRPPQNSDGRPPPLVTSFTENIPLPTTRPAPNNPPNAPDNGIPPRPNDPPNNSPNDRPNGSPSNPPSNLPVNQPGNPITTIGNQPIVADPSRPGVIIIGTPGSPSATTLTPGGEPIVVSGTTLSISPSGTALTISGSTSLNPIAMINGQPVYINPAHPGRVVVGDPSKPLAQQTYSADNNGIIVISGTTLSIRPAATAAAQSDKTPQSTVTISGLPIALLPDGSVSIIADGVTHTLRPGAPQISVGGHTIFLGPAGQLVVDGQPYRLDTKSTPNEVVIIGPDGSRTTVAMSQATLAAAQRESTSVSPKETGSARSSSRESSGPTTSTGLEGSGVAKASPKPTSKGGAASLNTGILGLVYMGMGLAVALLSIC
ncbi:hypothetical protein GQ44DRAFT_755881 [Phaeosphaeriaceae sp. PMI808]|nr:hypothetical protein GQ44DRAFT_755881 [Phaeosphaeriaceae sp. PMI808]